MIISFHYIKIEESINIMKKSISDAQLHGQEKEEVTSPFSIFSRGPRVPHFWKLFRNKGIDVDIKVFHCTLRVFINILPIFFFSSSLIFCGMPLRALLIPLVRLESLLTVVWRVAKGIVFPFSFSCCCIWGYVLPALRAAKILLHKKGNSSHLACRTLPARRGPCGQCGVFVGFGMPLLILWIRSMNYVILKRTNYKLRNFN